LASHRNAVRIHQLNTHATLSPARNFILAEIFGDLVNVGDDRPIETADAGAEIACAGATEAFGPITGNAMIRGAAMIDARKTTNEHHLQLEIAAEMNKSVLVSHLMWARRTFSRPLKSGVETRAVFPHPRHRNSQSWCHLDG
jgi:hypothetical protein